MRGVDTPKGARVSELVRPIAEAEGELEEILNAGSRGMEGEGRSADPQVRFHHLLERLPALVFELAPRGTILAVNPAVASATGFRREELLGENWWELLCPREFSRKGAELRRQLESGDVRGYELSLLPRSGPPLVVELTTANGYGPEGELERVVGMAVDVTARRRAEEQLQEGRNTLERRIAERTAQLSEALEVAERRAAQAEEGRAALEELREQHELYLHTISHDLRVPLTVIYGHVQLLKKDLAPAAGSDLDQNLETVVRSAERMNLMIEDLVDAARLDGGALILDRGEIDLGNFLDDFLGRSGLALEVDRIRLEIPPGLPSVRADADRLERILLNLVSNALKYSRRNSLVRISASLSGRNLQIAVSDRGTGIASEDQPHIFDRFYRTGGERRGDSVGLGLYITRMLVEAHGGRIWVESRPGEGSTFFFTLPLDGGG